MAIPISAIIGGVGAAGGIASGVGNILGSFGIGQGPAYAESPAGNRLHDILEKGYGYGNLPYVSGKSLETAFKTGQLPLPLQRQLQSIYPMTQAMYTGTMDQAALGANAAREDVARRYAYSGVTGPQLTKSLQDIDDMMRSVDLAAMRESKGMYANALANAYGTIYGQAFSEPRAWFGLGSGGSYPSTSTGIGPGLSATGDYISNIMKSIAGYLPSTAGAGSSTPYTLPGQLPMPMVSGNTTGNYNIPGVLPPLP